MLDVSIIIPVFCPTEESLGWFEECLNSALEQGCEVVCYADGQDGYTDKAIRIARSKAIVGASLSHGGVSLARNSCVELATRSLLLPLDCDDTLAPQAVRKLHSAWDGGIPVYPDVRKFGLVEVPHFALMDFSCEHVLNTVGFTSVNVLHSKAQWKSLGGWNPAIEFYEDGEYNARLLGTYCGVRYPEPLVNYRIHENQRTKLYEKQAAEYAKKILALIRSMSMPCPSCGKQRKTSSNDSSIVMGKSGNVVRGTPTEVKVNKTNVTLPSEFEGRVLAQYMGGKGMGKHTYRGPRSKTAYRVTYEDYIYADPSDVADTPDNGWTRLVRAVTLSSMKQPQPVPEQPKLEVKPEPERVVERKAVIAGAVERQPVEMVKGEEPIQRKPKRG